MERTIVIGDIHGCYHTLSDLLKECEAVEADRYIFLGDYIDYGPSSYEIVQRLLNAQKAYGPDKFILLRGDHEQMAIHYAHKAMRAIWEKSGMTATETSYKPHTGAFREHVKAFREMPIFHQTEDFIFCHAGLTHPKLKDNGKEELLCGSKWMRESYETREKRVIFGHTPMKDAPCYMPTGDIGIDGGCVFGGNLCAVVIEHDTGRLRFFSVPQNEKDKR